MFRLTDIKQGVRLNGIIPNETIEVIAAMPMGDDAVEPCVSICEWFGTAYALWQYA